MSSTLQSTYQLSSFTGLTGKANVVHDWDSDTDAAVMARPFYDRELEAQVRSGDYFISLATTLDELSNSLESHPARAKLEDIVSDLIYLYDNYDIDRRRKEERAAAE